jgi:hypothetical protein
MKRMFVIAAFILTTSLSVLAQSQTREDQLKEIEAKRAELATLEKQFLAPSAGDRELYGHFLSQPDTGLVRLLPRETYDTEVYKEKKQTLTVRGGGSYYSFTARTHEYSSMTDLGLEQGYLYAGFAGANYGMLTNIGDVPLETVNLETPAARVLAAHNPPSAEPDARVEQRRTSTGEDVEGMVFKNRVPLLKGSTYLLRNVNYSSSDTLVAFRVVRIDTDDSAIIVWKLLKKYPIPRLARN